MTHWATTYIGDDWISGEHDCWGFARRVWREQFGWDVPQVPSISLLADAKALSSHPERHNWTGVVTPKEGDAVLMGFGHRPHHIGIWCDADGGGVLHAVEGSGVIFQRPTALATAGWNILTLHRRAA